MTDAGDEHEERGAQKPDSAPLRFRRLPSVELRWQAQPPRSRRLSNAELALAAGFASTGFNVGGVVGLAVGGTIAAAPCAVGSGAMAGTWIVRRLRRHPDA